MKLVPYAWCRPNEKSTCFRWGQEMPSEPGAWYPLYSQGMVNDAISNARKLAKELMLDECIGILEAERRSLL